MLSAAKQGLHITGSYIYMRVTDVQLKIIARHLTKCFIELNFDFAPNE